MMLVGATGSGKTNFIKFLFKNGLKQKFNLGVVICNTYELHESYDGLVEPEFVHNIENKNDFSIFDSTFRSCKRFIEEGKKFQTFIIIDDMIGSINFKDERFVRYMATCRHYNISIFILMQQITLYLPPGVRENVKYIGIFKIRETSIDVTYKYVQHNFKNIKEYVSFLKNRPIHTMILLYPDPEYEDDKMILIKPELII